MVKRGAKTRRAASAVDQLQAALTRSIKDSVEETVSSVCKSFQQAVEKQTAAAATTEGEGGYDSYYNTCRTLVDYIQEHMDASPSFSEQMDRIILAAHSGATERVLNSVVTKEIWFHCRDNIPPSRAESERETRSSSSSSGRGRLRSVTTKKIKKEVPTPSSGRMATRASTESPAMHTRSAGSKRPTRTSSYDAQPVKRPRRAARRAIQESSEEEEEEEKPVKTRGKAKKQKQEEEEEDDDELLQFEDAIGELCYPDRRTPAQTEQFKERLRKSIQFVDALLCKPPQGKVCGRGCKKIRAQMCSSSTPCKNKMCRIWHDVEAHTDRCQNPQCEFKNRILLRETMHKLEMKEQQIEVAKAEVESKQAELKEAADDEKGALENDIGKLKSDLEECDTEVGVLEATKKTFWGNLNEIGIQASDDVKDNFPDFATHYVEKAPRKERKTGTISTSHLSSASNRGSRAAARNGSSGPHGAADEDEGDDADGESVGGNTRRRAARRSTSSGRQSTLSHNDSDEETKGGDEETKGDDDDDTYHPALSTFPRPDEPPLPPAGPPPFRQNPEFDRDYSTLASGYSISASGYSIHPPADDLEAPAVAANIEPPKEVEPPSVNGLTEEQLADMQRESEEISGIMAGLSANPPPLPSTLPAPAPAPTPAPVVAEPLNSTGFTIRGNQTQSQ